MTSPEARRAPAADDRIGSPGDAARIAVERLNNALYVRRVSPLSQEAAVDVQMSIAASLIRIWQSMPPQTGEIVIPGDRAAEILTARNDALARALKELIARVDRLEDDQPSERLDP